MEHADSWTSYLHSSASSPSRDDCCWQVPAVSPSKVLYVHAGNLESSLQMINQTLRHFGLPAPTVLPCDNTSDAAFTANILYLLLQHRTQADQRMKEAEENLKRCQFDLNVARNNQGRLKDLLQKREEECKSLELKLLDVTNTSKKEKARLIAERDKAVADKIAMQHRDTQMQHQQRKLEQEKSKMQEKIKTLIDQRDRQAKAGMEITARVREKENILGRAQWAKGGGVGEDEFFHKVIKGYESREQQLLQENANMRSALAVLQKELVDTLNQAEGRPPVHAGVDETMEGRMLMPFDIVQRDIQQSLRDRMEALRNRIKALDKEEADRLSKENNSPLYDRHYVERLEAEVSETRKLLSEQENLIQAYLTQPTNFASPALERASLSHLKSAQKSPGAQHMHNEGDATQSPSTRMGSVIACVESGDLNSWQKMLAPNVPAGAYSPARRFQHSSPLASSTSTSCAATPDVSPHKAKDHQGSDERLAASHQGKSSTSATPISSPHAKSSRCHTPSQSPHGKGLSERASPPSSSYSRIMRASPNPSSPETTADRMHGLRFGDTALEETGNAGETSMMARSPGQSMFSRYMTHVGVDAISPV